jgi:magnesium-transporting ATPase (P-type)
MVSSAVIGGLILISIVAIIIMAFRKNKPEKDQKKSTHLKVPLLRDDPKEKLQRED